LVDSGVAVPAVRSLFFRGFFAAPSGNFADISFNLANKFNTSTPNINLAVRILAKVVRAQCFK
jgi:hypothetical protein